MRRAVEGTALFRSRSRNAGRQRMTDASARPWATAHSVRRISGARQASSTVGAALESRRSRSPVPRSHARAFDPLSSFPTGAASRVGGIQCVSGVRARRRDRVSRSRQEGRKTAGQADRTTRVESIHAQKLSTLCLTGGATSFSLRPMIRAASFARYYYYFATHLMGRRERMR